MANNKSKNKNNNMLSKKKHRNETPKKEKKTTSRSGYEKKQLSAQKTVYNHKSNNTPIDLKLHEKREEVAEVEVYDKEQEQDAFERSCVKELEKIAKEEELVSDITSSIQKELPDIKKNNEFLVKGKTLCQDFSKEFKHFAKHNRQFEDVSVSLRGFTTKELKEKFKETLNEVWERREIVYKELFKAVNTAEINIIKREVLTNTQFNLVEPNLIRKRIQDNCLSEMVNNPLAELVLKEEEPIISKVEEEIEENVEAEIEEEGKTEQKQSEGNLEESLEELLEDTRKEDLELFLKKIEEKTQDELLDPRNSVFENKFFDISKWENRIFKDGKTGIGSFRNFCCSVERIPTYRLSQYLLHILSEYMNCRKTKPDTKREYNAIVEITKKGEIYGEFGFDFKKFDDSKIETPELKKEMKRRKKLAKKILKGEINGNNLTEKNEELKDSKNNSEADKE